MIKIYFAGVKRTYLPQLQADSPILLSYASSSERALLPELQGREVILDSGAFSVWRQGHQIDLDAYMTFVSAHPWLTAVVALDVIGGTAEQQLANLDQMEAARLPVTHWPVYHKGDDWDLLLEYRRRGYAKIGLSAAASIGQSSAIDWLWRVLRGCPPTATQAYHGLGLTQQEILATMDGWLESVDSTSWLTLAKYGFKRNAHLLNGRSKPCLREMGRLLMEDIAQHGVQAESVEQLPLFQELGA